MKPKKHKYKYKTRKQKQQQRTRKQKQQRNNKKTRQKQKARIKPNRNNNRNNDNNYREAAPRTPHICDNIDIPKSVKPKRTRIFAIIGHSSFCTFDDLMKIKANREPKGFRLDLKKYKDFPNVRYIPAQDIGKKSSALRMEYFIKQLKTNEKIYSGLLQLDDIKSTRNFSKLVECEFFKNNNTDYKFIKNRLRGENPTLNFNVYPKKDKYGTQNPINTEYDFIHHDPNGSFTGIYELTEEIDDNSNNNNNNNNNSISSLDIHSDEILFNPDIRTDFFEQRERSINVLKNQSKIIKTKENLNKNPYDPTYISKWSIQNSKFSALRGSLMIPNSKTQTKLLGQHLYYEDEFNDFTRLNKKLFRLIEGRRQFEVSLDDIISIILNDNYMRSDDDFIILDFGCKHIRDIIYSNNVWDRPLNTNTRESTVKFDYTLKKEMGPVWVKENKTHPYVINKLFAEAGN